MRLPSRLIRLAMVMLVLGLALVAARPQPAKAAAPVLYTQANLNLRVGPGLDHQVILVMPEGSLVYPQIFGDGWDFIYYDGQFGWASSDYLAGVPPNQDTANQPSSNSGGIIEIIRSAAAYYSQDADAMIAVARCESDLDPGAYNPSSGASGLFQFLPGTWATTPYASQDIFDPWANAYAAAWMWSVGRRGEWVC